MAQETEEKEAQVQEATKEAVQEQNFEAQLLESSDLLMDYGGFDLLIGAVDGVSVMDPGSARKNIFLTESARKTERKKLLDRISLWLTILEGHEDVAGMIEATSTTASSSFESLKTNMKIALDTTKDLERSYRSVANFYRNAEIEKVRNISIVNAGPDRVKDLNNTLVIDMIDKELTQNHDRLDLRDNYSLLVIPGYMGSNAVINKWAKIAFRNKVLLITDFADLENHDGVIEEFSAADLTGSEFEKSNVMVTCNWLVGRGQFEEYGEDEPLFVPPSAALAGKLYSTLISQPPAGKIYGGLNDVTGVRFELKKTEISELERIGLIPMVDEWSKVIAMSAKTLYNGNDIGLQTYSVVRVFDYIGKVLIDFLNRQAFVNWTVKVERDLRREIARYLDSVKGHGKIIEKFEIMNIKQDKETKNIHLDIHITPFFPAKSFLVRLGGTQGDTAEEWMAQYEED